SDAAGRRRPARSGPDVRVLPGALQERRGLHVLLRGRLQRRPDYAAAHHLPRVAAVDRDLDGPVARPRPHVSDDDAARDGDERDGAEESDGDYLLHGYEAGRARHPPPSRRDEHSRNPSARYAPRGTGRHLFGRRRLLGYVSATWLWHDERAVRQLA